MVDDLVDLTQWQQRPVSTLVTGLAARRAARPLPARPFRRRGRILRRRQRRVARTAIQTTLELANPSLEPLVRLDQPLIGIYQLVEPQQQPKQDGDRTRLQAQIAPLHDKLRTLLEQAARKSSRTKYHRLFAKSLLKRWPALWTFAHHDGVEPTNNHAERGLRGAVIYRKLSLGSQSERGERTIERLLSTSVTCRLQKRSLFAYLADVFSANVRGDPIPALA
jgi:Transposase IS66 family